VIVMSNGMEPDAVAFLQHQALLHPAGPGDATRHEEDETCGILRQRLTGLFPVGSAVWGSLFVLGLTGTDPAFSREHVGGMTLALLGLATAASIASAIFLRTRPNLSLFWLRKLELLVFGSYAAAVAALRLALYGRGLRGTFVDPESSDLFLRWSAAYNCFGWFSLVVLYGVMIPNTWRRALAVVLALVLIPVIIDSYFILTEPNGLQRLAYPLLISGQIMLVGVTIALLGSSRFGALQREAQLARREARAARAMGPYVLKERLGVGGMGEVYLAEHRLLKRPCAVKLIRQESAGDPQALARFDREVRATARLKHPNTVEVFDYGRHEDGTFYYVMEYLDGLGLDEVVSRFGPLPAARVLHVLQQLCGALHEAHSMGLVHRDIKPSNVLLCRHGGFHDVVKLVDFGLVQTAAVAAEGGPLTQAGSILGTPEYMSPEQADGSGLDARSDLYSLGATAYCLLTGGPPFAGRTTLDVLIAHRQAPVPALGVDGVPAALESIIRRCLAKKPEDRYPSAEKLNLALADCVLDSYWTETEARDWWNSTGALSKENRAVAGA
jgi:serine/threonine-protein kinase